MPLYLATAHSIDGGFARLGIAASIAAIEQSARMTGGRLIEALLLDADELALIIETPDSPSLARSSSRRKICTYRYVRVPRCRASRPKRSTARIESAARHQPEQAERRHSMTTESRCEEMRAERARLNIEADSMPGRLPPGPGQVIGPGNPSCGASTTESTTCVKSFSRSAASRKGT